MSYIEYNINPKHKKVDDCAIRAVAVATGLGWDDAYKQLAIAGFQQKCAMNDVEAINIVLLNNGFKIGTIKISKGDHRPTVKAFAVQHPNWYCVLRIANHLVASGKGNYVDIWDCGDSAVYKYWYKEII